MGLELRFRDWSLEMDRGDAAQVVVFPYDPGSGTYSVVTRPIEMLGSSGFGRALLAQRQALDISGRYLQSLTKSTCTLENGKPFYTGPGVVFEPYLSGMQFQVSLLWSGF